MREPIAVRHLAAPDIHLVVDWARQEGWNPGINDASCFYAADPGGFLASLNREAPAAVISLVRYDASFAFLGLYICQPDLRGQGYGFRVWEASMASAGARTIALDGVPAQQEKYTRSGFELAWRNTRYEIQEGTGDDIPGLIDLDSVPFTDITRYDADVFEADRRTFLRFWLAQPGASRLGIVHDGRLAGWGLLKPCAEGSKIGPPASRRPGCTGARRRRSTSERCGASRPSNSADPGQCALHSSAGQNAAGPTPTIRMDS